MVPIMTSGYLQKANEIMMITRSFYHCAHHYNYQMIYLSILILQREDESSYEEYLPARQTAKRLHHEAFSELWLKGDLVLLEAFLNTTNADFKKHLRGRISSNRQYPEEAQELVQRAKALMKSQS